MPFYILKPSDPGKPQLGPVSATDEHGALARFNQETGMRLTLDPAGARAAWTLLSRADDAEVWDFQPAIGVYLPY